MRIIYKDDRALSIHLLMYGAMGCAGAEGLRGYPLAFWWVGDGEVAP